jgi:hypothetical protein
MRGKRVRSQRSMRAFDRVRLGTAECAGWAGYYANSGSGCWFQL